MVLHVVPPQMTWPEMHEPLHQAQDEAQDAGQQAQQLPNQEAILALRTGS